MVEKPKRNDPCPCGSGKKFKQCCIAKDGTMKRKISAVWVNKPAPEGVNLMDRTFGNALSQPSTALPSFLTPPPVATEHEQPERSDSSSE